MTDEDARHWMQHPGATRSTTEVVAGLLAAASQTLTDEARDAIAAGIARVVSSNAHAHHWKLKHDAVVEMHAYEVTFRRQLEEQCQELHRRIAELEGFSCR